jgi:hypothetical protein
MTAAVAWGDGNGVSEGADQGSARSLFSHKPLDESPGDARGAIDFHLEWWERTECHAKLFEDADASLASVPMLQAFAALPELFWGRGTGMYN